MSPSMTCPLSKSITVCSSSPHTVDTTAIRDAVTLMAEPQVSHGDTGRWFYIAL